MEELAGRSYRWVAFAGATRDGINSLRAHFEGRICFVSSAVTSCAVGGKGLYDGSTCKPTVDLLRANIAQFAAVACGRSASSFGR